MGGLLLRIGIIAAIGGGAYVFRDFLPGNAADLSVGDCFDAPTTIDETVEDVAHHPCTDAHTAEAFYVADYPAADAYPGVEAFDEFTESNCVPAFQAYTGLDFFSAQAEDYEMGMFYPLEEGWRGGDHEIACYLARFDGGPMTGSLKKQ